MKILSIIASLCMSQVLAATTTNSNTQEEAGTAQHASGHSWNYKTNGADWPKLADVKDNECAGSNQSPIDLKNTWNSKSARYDNFNKLYTDQTGDIEVVWNGHTSQTAVNKKTQDRQTFDSTHAAKTFGANQRFTGAQFHFHHGSEHTVEGKRHDLEMHTVHLPTDGAAGKNGFIASAMGLFFSVNDYTRTVTADEERIIDGFFESLSWSTTDKNPKVKEVPYGKLMMMADMNNRWTYVGSVTTPPCAQNVYWNVLRTVYPIKKRHMDQFMTQLKRSSLEVTGNYRVIQKETKDHNPYIVSGGSALTSAQKVDLNINVNGGSGSSSSANTVLASSGSAGLKSTNGYLETVTILLIVAILFLLIAVLVVVKNSFDKRPPYQSVEAGAAEGGEREMTHAVYRE